MRALKTKFVKKQEHTKPCCFAVDKLLMHSIVFGKYVAKDSTLFALSRLEANANQAVRICSSAGGKLMQRDKLEDFILKEYVSGLNMLHNIVSGVAWGGRGHWPFLFDEV